MEATGRLKLGSDDTDDFGPVINKTQLDTMVAAVERACAAGATMVTGVAVVWPMRRTRTATTWRRPSSRTRRPMPKS